MHAIPPLRARHRKMRCQTNEFPPPDGMCKSGPHVTSKNTTFLLQLVTTLLFAPISYPHVLEMHPSKEQQVPL